MNFKRNKKWSDYSSFLAQWCTHCKMLSLIFEELLVDMDEWLNFLKVDVDRNLEIANKYNVVNIPTMVILKHDEKWDVITGFSSKKEIEENIKKYLLEERLI
ncbi:thioredoxin family protein [Clostridium sp.]|uniref:thioredoxin family protein n=1 Tax=Clostridium sp. TaxID=1506 RepID=UPI002FC61698